MLFRITKTLFILLLFPSISWAQDSTFQNTSDQILQSTGALSIRGYGQIDYNQPLLEDVRSNGKLDVHRLVLFLGYKFSEKTSFVSEFEFEHVKEIYVEQAYVQHRLSRGLNLKAGLVLIPMGIINEYHEPTTFHGVERPNLDKNIVPTTWREIGAGISGNIPEASLKYQAYVVNGFKSYDDGGILKGSNGLRSGRQKAAESIISHPNFSGKLEYYGLKNTRFGVSGYGGKTQSTLFDGLAENNSLGRLQADSSVVNVAMIGLDGRFVQNGLEVTGQWIHSWIGNTNEYNALTDRDLGSEMDGYYIEAAYNVLESTDSESELLPFVRFEQYNTHAETEEGTSKDLSYNRTEVTTGLTWRVHEGVALKSDIQFLNNEAIEKAIKQLNLGVGVWF